MYGSSLHVEVFCLAQPGSVNLSLDFATSLARSSFARCAVVMLGLQTDSPSQRQPRLANAEASTGDTQASPHVRSSYDEYRLLLAGGSKMRIRNIYM